MRPLGGTHGALSATNSLAVLMLNFADTRDDLTSSVRQQFGGFPDLHDLATQESSLRLTTTAILGADRWSSFSDNTAPGALSSLPDSEPLLVLLPSDKDRRWAGAASHVLVDIRQKTAGRTMGGHSLHLRHQYSRVPSSALIFAR